MNKKYKQFLHDYRELSKDNKKHVRYFVNVLKKNEFELESKRTIIKRKDVFIERKSTHVRPSTAKNLLIEDAVRVSFITKKVGGYYFTVHIGKSIADKLDLDVGDRICLFYRNLDHREWLIKKTLLSYQGYKVIKPGHYGKIARHYTVRMKWDFFTPQYAEKKIHMVDFEVNAAKKELIIKL